MILKPAAHSGDYRDAGFEPLRDDPLRGHGFNDHVEHGRRILLVLDLAQTTFDPRQTFLLLGNDALDLGLLEPEHAPELIAWQVDRMAGARPTDPRSARG